MKSSIKRIIQTVIFLLGAMLLTGCANTQCKTSFRCVDEYGSIELELNKEELLSKGFKLGDAFRIEYEAADGSKQVLEDVPCVSTYSVKKGMVILVAYPSDDHIKIACSSIPVLDVAKPPKDGSIVTLTLTGAGKYKELNDIINIRISEERDEYDDDESYVNFRDIIVGKIKPGRLSRSSSPINDYLHRADAAAAVAIANDVNTYVDLAEDRETAMKYYDQMSLRSRQTVDDDRTIFAHLLPQYKSAKTINGLIYLFDQLSKTEPKYNVYCAEGKDRTGYVCAMLEALCGASYEEIVDDYMKSYEQLYRVDKEKDKNTYDYYAYVKFTEILENFTGCKTVEELKKADLFEVTRNYLIGIGIPQTQIDTVIRKLTE